MKPPYIQIEPGTPAYNQVITEVILSKNISLLARIRDKIGKPIHLVNQWFYYHIMTLGTHSDYIVIYDQEANIQFKKFEEALQG